MFDYNIDIKRIVTGPPTIILNYKLENNKYTGDGVAERMD